MNVANEMSINGQHAMDLADEMGEQHVATATDTPLRADAFELDDEIKIELIAYRFEEIMQIMGLDLTDDSLSGTPRRVAKMYVREIFKGLNPDNKPAITLFGNTYQYREMLVERDIKVNSYCEHHFVPIIGKAHVAYISSGKVIGLSKLNRLVDYYSRRPQVQERLTVQIGNELVKALETEDVALLVEANHMCVSSRGIEDENSSTVTSFYKGKFLNEHTKNEFLQMIRK